jgi:hypothetical protein
VAVYVIYTIILREALPGTKSSDKVLPGKVATEQTTSPSSRKAEAEVVQAG